MCVCLWHSFRGAGSGGRPVGEPGLDAKPRAGLARALRWPVGGRVPCGGTTKPGGRAMWVEWDRRHEDADGRAATGRVVLLGAAPLKWLPLRHGPLEPLTKAYTR